MLLKHPFKSSFSPIYSMKLSLRSYQWCFTPSYNVVRERSEERQRKVNCRFDCLLSQSSVNPQVFFHLTYLCASICALIHQPATLLLGMKSLRIMGHNQTVVLWLHGSNENYCFNKAHHFPQGKIRLHAAQHQIMYIQFGKFISPILEEDYFQRFNSLEDKNISISLWCAFYSFIP